MPAPASATADDSELLARLGAGEQDEPLRTLYRRYGGRVYGLGVQLLGDRGMAEELVQETFLRLWTPTASPPAPSTRMSRATRACGSTPRSIRRSSRS